ncbi:glycosyl transferase [Actinobacillus equuli]|uniref:glycosyl transferase n=1 Tax=Actinobacillus equuli TaxID=718 RepID=UPI002440ED81|nr:glycosyl transferase [Actinobacillus equuli]WGE42144.1 glycosyl transferase [Actinobacillus equuli subsp. haemolyticus]WGE50681.1 glycosyl transferase [Actinobacillus equuli subsp. haemolyticus]WGE52851.1 glycosyl transferase [Actinobacillus equuli subsp. haemolyticus]WGE73295.1 glycosyl transferase [Actinobacillus equuli subsp. haemolyticus]
MQYIIQSCVYPKISLCSQLELYFRKNTYVDLNLSNSYVLLDKFGCLITDTYFNSLSVGKWKRHTNVNDLHFVIKFKGKIKITWYVNRLHFSRKIVKEVYLENKELSKVQFELEFWNELEDGMLAFNIEALETSEVHDFTYVTSTVPSNKVSLGIVITHFNRQQYVLPALERLKLELLADPNFKSKVVLNVVDNSQNLPEVDGVNIIPNENLGGSGGFTRGLMVLKESGGYTHCLFMDDDASCEVEGIKRTIALLEFAKDSTLSIGGAMLREDEVYRQYENGAKFNGLLTPIKAGLDLRDVHSLLINELEEKIDFCGWWYFAFPLSEVKHYAFPFFVRGDDIGFGLAHKFNIITLNGISSWQGDFALKHGPLPAYLDNRHQIMQHFHHFSEQGVITLVKVTARMTLRNLFTYHYDTALASISALEDAMKGNAFWKENVDMAAKRKEIGSLIENEKVGQVPISLRNIAYPGNPNESRIMRICRWATLNGHLLPMFFFKRGLVWQNKAQGHLREVYLHKKVLYIHWPTNTGFVLEHNKAKFFSLLFRYIKAVCKLMIDYKRLKKEYQLSYNELTSTVFWKKQFKQDQ